MCEKMEELKTTPRPLSLNDGWDQQVNGKAKKLDDRLEMERQHRAEAVAQRKAIQRANRIMRLVALALAMIAAGGVYMFYTEKIPLWVSASVAVGGVAIICFLLGMLVGKRRG